MNYRLVFTCLVACVLCFADRLIVPAVLCPSDVCSADPAPAAATAAPSSSASCTPTTTVKPLGKVIKLLLAHERTLLASGDLVNVTHEGSSSVWLHAESTPASALADGMTLVYRPMGDAEVLHLLEHGGLPDSQTYQAIIEGAGGRVYSEKYLNGANEDVSHNSSPSSGCALAASQRHE